MLQKKKVRQSQQLNEILIRLSPFTSCISPSRLLWSQNSGQLTIPRISKSTAGGRSSYLPHKLWNSLPNIVQEADTLLLV